MPENPKSPLTPEQEEELQATEMDVILLKHRHYCTLHRRRIDGLIYACPGCRAFYCGWGAREMEYGNEGCLKCGYAIKNAGAAPGETRESGKKLENVVPDGGLGSPDDVARRMEVICLVHKGTLAGIVYICQACDATYCMKCAQTLKQAGENCWNCGRPFNW